jgi:hypothetical protein
MQTKKLRFDGILGFACGALALVACGGSGAHSSTGSTSGTSSASATGSTQAATGSSGTTTASTGAIGSAGTGAGAGSSAGGSAGAGTGSSASAGAGPGSSTGAGTGSSAGSSAGAGADAGAGPSDAAIGGDGPVATAGCSNNNYPLCIDFENGIDTTIWTGGTASAITTVDAAHGTHSYRLYPMGGGLLTVKQLGPITNQLWGRFYVHFVPEAPGGHGNILGAYDQSNNWYEIGWQFNGILGDYHTNNSERPLRSMPYLVDQWYCIESFFDGTQTNMPVWWINGEVPDYYMPDNTTLIPTLVTQFAKITVGFTPYAGLGIPQTPYGNSGPPALTNMYIDDIAFDTKRIGCIE